jgi:hypothetical protein
MGKKNHARGSSRRKVRLPVPLEVVGDAAIASHRIGDGRLIPVLIVDTTTRPDLDEIARIHQHLPAGECKFQWGENLDEKNQVVLLLDFLRPVQASFVIGLDVVSQGILVDSILMAQALYLQPGRPGDRIITKMDAPRILVEVPRVGFEDVWEKLLRHGLRKMFRDKGLSRPSARSAVEEAVEKLRAITNLRYKPLPEQHE